MREALKESKLAPNIAKRIMCEYLGLSFEKLFLRLDDECPCEYLALCERFSAGEPIQYIFGRCEFLGREFEINKNVLIPRDETEILVEKALELAKNITNPVIFDICTGSGIIAISLALECENSRILASDISDKALEIAEKNAFKLGTKNITFLKSDLLENFPQKADIIVSNPPYIANDYKLDKWVLNEPKIALFGGAKGDEILKRLIAQSAKRTKYLFCEMGYDQKQSMKNELSKYKAKVEFYRDLAGFDRGFVAEF